MSHWETIQDIALDNYGLVTTSQAVALDISPVELARWTQIGRLEKRALGVFRLSNRVPTDFDRYAEALAIVGGGAMIFGESVLSMHNLALVNPARIEVSTTRRVRKRIPPWIKLVTLSSAEEAEVFDGIACQPVARAIMACIGRVPSDRLIVAVDEARGQGLISSKSDKELRKVLG